MTGADDEGRWNAVLVRDARCDGSFVYAVRSTGIYCRPSCPSRRPRRDRVAFFATTESARRAGFRSCRRCRPDERPGPAAHVELVGRICRYLENGPDRPPTLEELGAWAGVSPFHLQRTFRKIVGLTPRQYAENHRVERLKANLRKGDDVTRALHGSGYGSGSRLYEQARERLGMTPATYRKGGHGMKISYTLADSPMGRLLVAATDRGLCAVSLGDDDAELVAALRKEYPRAELVADKRDLGRWVDAILSYLAGEPICPDLPLDLQATAFQWRVYEALRAIPPGSTRTYAEVAGTLGQPRASRAVGRSCATNPVALVIPCHRVVRGDGALGGYRWGLDRKQRLLALERESDATSPDSRPGTR